MGVPAGVLGGVGGVPSGVGAGRRLPGAVGAVAGRGAVLLHCVGSVPGVVSSVLLSIVASYGGAWVQVGRVRWPWWCLSAVQPGLLAVLPGVVAGAGSCQRRSCVRSGSCLCSGLFPNCIAGFQVYPDRFLRR